MNNTGENYNAYLVEMVKAAGQDIVENAEALVGTMRYRTDFTIQLTFDQQGVPMIEVLTSYVSKKCMERDTELRSGEATLPNLEKKE